MTNEEAWQKWQWTLEQDTSENARTIGDRLKELGMKNFFKECSLENLEYIRSKYSGIFRQMFTYAIREKKGEDPRTF